MASARQKPWSRGRCARHWTAHSQRPAPTPPDAHRRTSSHLRHNNEPMDTSEMALSEHHWDHWIRQRQEQGEMTRPGNEIQGMLDRCGKRAGGYPVCGCMRKSRNCAQSECSAVWEAETQGGRGASMGSKKEKDRSWGCRAGVRGGLALCVFEVSGGTGLTGADTLLPGLPRHSTRTWGLVSGGRNRWTRATSITALPQLEHLRPRPTPQS